MINVGKLRWIKYIDKDVFTALAWFSSWTLSKQIYANVSQSLLFFSTLPLSLSLSLSLSLALCWRITQVKNTQIVKGYLHIALDFPQILLTTTGTFYLSFSSLVSSVFIFSLVSFTFYVCVFFVWNKKYVFWYTFDYAGR